MLRSSREFARCIFPGGSISGNKLSLSTQAAALRKTRQRTSRKSLLLAAAAGTSCCCGAAISNDDGETKSTISKCLASLGTPIKPQTTITTRCDTDIEPELPSAREAKLKRKKTVLKVAASLERLNTRQQVSRLRIMQDEMLTRWERDEEGWRNLPSRAWPEYQPNSKQLESIVAEIERLGCTQMVLGDDSGAKSDTPHLVRRTSCSLMQCKKLLFHMASGLVFYQVDPPAGFALYESLAKRGHTDSMVACGIMLVEGLGVPPREQEGLVWLEKAMESQSDDASSMSAAQASYELAVVYYTGIDGVVEEDPEKAFGLFQRAAKSDHTAALYMVADCLVEGEGTERNIHKAVPLFYKAAERGHRYSRQRIRELLGKGGFPL